MHSSGAAAQLGANPGFPANAVASSILLKQNDEWAVQRARYMTLETITGLSDDPLVSLPATAA